MAAKTATSKIGRENVGRIAERIVSNALEARGFRVTDLNSDGLSANADLLAAKNKRVWQIQVKGMTNGANHRSWRVQYGYCTAAVVSGRQSMFNRTSSFYKADVVVLVAVRSATDYCCVVLPVRLAEKAAQLNLKRGYRRRKRDGSKKKPHKVWRIIDGSKREKDDPTRNNERRILAKHIDGWGVLSRRCL